MNLFKQTIWERSPWALGLTPAQVIEKVDCVPGARKIIGPDGREQCVPIEAQPPPATQTGPILPPQGIQTVPMPSFQPTGIQPAAMPGFQQAAQQATQPARMPPEQRRTGGLTLDESREFLRILERVLDVIARTDPADAPCIMEIAPSIEIANKLRDRMSRHVQSASAASNFPISEEETASTDAVIVCADSIVQPEEAGLPPLATAGIIAAVIGGAAIAYFA